MDDPEKSEDFQQPVGIAEPQVRHRQNLTQAVINRELNMHKGLVPPEFQTAAEDKFIEKHVMEEMSCKFPDTPKSTFLMVFSPDGKKVASTHGNHNVYVTDLATGKNIKTLTGHPRTPWCIAFHPSSNQILASGCLGGQVRVWDLTGGSEIWTSDSQTVIASLVFHPVDRLLVIATFNELHFWDWSQPQPFAKSSTMTEREKVRYVTFDRLGHKLITGIANPVAVQSQWDRVSNYTPSTTSTIPTTSTSSASLPISVVAPTSERERSIAFCYRNLMNQYNQLVRRYFDLSRSRVTPTMDRGTDPMDVMDLSNQPGPSQSSAPGPSGRPTRHPDPDAESTSSGSGSEASTPVSSNITPTELSYFPWERTATTTVTTQSGTNSNPFTRFTMSDSTRPTYTWSRGVVSPRETPRDSTTPFDAGSYSTDLLRALLRDVASSESHSGEDTEIELASRSDSPRAVVSRAESDHPRPVPTFQLRPRLLQDPSYQLRFLSRREPFTTSSSSGPSTSRRPGGQFVLSRHSNSPFQPRVPLRVEGPPVTTPPTSTPAIPSQASSFLPARRILYDQVRVYLRDRFLTAAEQSSDSTTNYSRLSREADADTGPDISWDGDSETLIIRPFSQITHSSAPGEENSNQSQTPQAEEVTSTPTQNSETSTRDLHSLPNPLREYDSLTSQIESMQRLIRARIEVLQITKEMRTAIGTRGVRSLFSSPSRSSNTNDPQPSTSSQSQPADGADIEQHWRGQLRRLHEAMSEWHGGADLLARRRRGESEQESGGASSSQTQGGPSVAAPVPGPSTQTNETPPPVNALSDYVKLANALAESLLQIPENMQPQPGPSTAKDTPFSQGLVNQLKDIVMRVTMRQLDAGNASRSSGGSSATAPQSTEAAQPGPSREASPPPPPLPPRAPTNVPRLSVRLMRLPTHFRRSGDAETALRGDGFHRENAGGWRQSAHRLSLPEERRYHRNKLSDRTRERDAIRTRIKRTMRALFQRRLGGILETMADGFFVRYQAGEGNHRRTLSDSSVRPDRPRASTSSSQETCRSCGLRKTGSSTKRKGVNPQRFRADKFSRLNGGERRNVDMSTVGFLQGMVDQMRNIVRMQRESERLGSSLTMTAEEASLICEINNEVRRLCLPLRIRPTPALIRTFRRNVAQLRAHQLLSNMVQGVTALCDSDSLLVDRDILKLYKLLQLALELTDVLLKQLQATREASREQAPVTTLEESTENSLPPEQVSVDESSSLLSQNGLHYSAQHTEALNLNVPSNPRFTSNSSNTPSISNTASGSSETRHHSFHLHSDNRNLSHSTAPATSTPTNNTSSSSSSSSSPSDGRPAPGTDGAAQHRVRLCGHGDFLHFRRMMANRRRGVSYEQDTPTEERESSRRSGRAAILNRYRRPGQWPVARVLPTGHIIGCVRRQRHVRFSSHSDVVNFYTQGQGIDSRAGEGSAASATSSNSGSTMEELRPRLNSWLATANAPQTPPTTDSNFTVPLVRVNDVPVYDTNSLPSSRPRSQILPMPPLLMSGEEASRWRYYRPRFLHPRYFGPNPFDEQDADNVDQQPTFSRMMNVTAGHAGLYTFDSHPLCDSSVSPHHRIQAWDFSHHVIPGIANRELNIVVGECKIHNDASVDVSTDGQLVVTLLPAGRLSVTTMLGVYSLEWRTLGQLLYKTGFEQNAVSVSLSPTARHLLVGLASRPLALRDRDRTNMAQIFRLGGAHALPADSWHSGRGILYLVRDLEQSRDGNNMSLNCIRWAPGPGHGMVYGTNTGLLKILR